MKKPLLNLAGIVMTLSFSVTSFAQTVGTFSFSFTPVAHSPCYQSSKNVLAVWIQTNAGAFVKTKIRYCCGGSTEDHLPAWGANSGGTASNCASAACNKTDATTGATLTSFTAKAITWDGKNVNGTANGTLVADGIYKVTIQSTWNHGTTGTVTKSYTFTKGPNADHQTPANDANFTNIKLDWVPASANGVEDISEDAEISIFPNPTNGIFHVDFQKASNIKVINTMGIVVYNEKIDQTNAGTRRIDLSNFSNGIYLINIMNGETFSNYKVILNK